MVRDCGSRQLVCKDRVCKDVVDPLADGSSSVQDLSTGFSSHVEGDEVADPSNSSSMLQKSRLDDSSVVPKSMADRFDFSQESSSHSKQQLENSNLTNREEEGATGEIQRPAAGNTSIVVVTPTSTSEEPQELLPPGRMYFSPCKYTMLTEARLRDWITEAITLHFHGRLRHEVG